MTPVPLTSCGASVAGNRNHHAQATKPVPLTRYDPLQALAYIARYREQHGERSPSQRQIQRDLGISVPSVAHNMLHRLARRELLTITTYGRGLPADFSLTEAGQKAVQAWERGQRSRSDRE